MIYSFIHKGLEDLFFDGVKKGVKPDHVKKLQRILDRLHAANNAEKDMNYPGSCLHKMEPRKDNRWSVKVSGNWRVTFTFIEGNAYDVDYPDYH